MDEQLHFVSHFVYEEDDGCENFLIYALYFSTNYLNEHSNHSQSIVLSESISEASVRCVVEDEVDLNKTCIPQNLFISNCSQYSFARLACQPLE